MNTLGSYIRSHQLVMQNIYNTYITQSIYKDKNSSFLTFIAMNIIRYYRQLTRRQYNFSIVYIVYIYIYIYIYIYNIITSMSNRYMA